MLDAVRYFFRKFRVLYMIPKSKEIHAALDWDKYREYKIIESKGIVITPDFLFLLNRKNPDNDAKIRLAPNIAGVSKVPLTLKNIL